MGKKSGELRKSEGKLNFFTPSWLVLTSTVTTALIFVVSTLISPSFRDDSFQFIKKCWMTAGEFRQAQWDRLLDYTGDDIITLWRYGTLTVFVGTYWIVGTIYTILDVTNKPAALRRYKVQPGTNEPVDTKRLIQVIALVLFNQTVASFPVAYFMPYLLLWRGSPPAKELPAFHWTVLQIAICVLIEEIGFYYSHRLLHHKSLYKYIHKKHHEWTAPIAIVAIYAHPLEHIVSNLLPPFIGVFILNCHISTAWLWFGLAVSFTLSEHSGYHLPFFPSPEAHDFHHFKFNNCFGVLGILDRLHGTDAQFRKTMSFPRHRMLTSLAPAREVYPDPVKKKK